MSTQPPVPPVPPPPPPAMPPPPPMPPAQTPGVPGVPGAFVYPNAPLSYLEAEQAVRDGKRGPLKIPTWGLGDVWITLALLFIFQFVGVIIVVIIAQAVDPAAASEDRLPNEAWISLSLTAFLWLGMGLWPFIASHLKGNGIKIDFGLRASWRDVGLGVLYGFLSFVVAIVLAAVSTALFGEFSSAAGDEAAQFKDSVVVTAIFALTIAFGAPFFEELCFRGLFLSSLAKRGMGAVLSITIPALVFSLMHFEPKRILLLFGVGCVFGLARWQSKSLTTAMVAHVMNNLPGAIGIFLLALGLDIPV